VAVPPITPAVAVSEVVAITWVVVSKVAPLRATGGTVKMAKVLRA
jgi:hypothetical protein